MYLIHAQLAVRHGETLPAALPEKICSQDVEPASVEYVVLHDEVPGVPVLGLFVAAADLGAAERAAELACLRVLAAAPSPAAWTVVRCEAGFVAEFYEWRIGDP
ncbi:hypothetical protein [Streptomyces sp. NPDC014746]|uniref:hypothetical protein n=1 Tax=Streptomyces sp. NPDC014746 TaxID=3364904 RepID=UPI0036FDCCB5